jgi:hypothetical protein
VLTDWDGDADPGASADALDQLAERLWPPATTAQITNVAATEAAGTSDTYARGDHRHAHGSGYSADAHHTQFHALDHIDLAGLDPIAVQYRYIGFPDAGFAADIGTGDAQGVIHHSNEIGVNETAIVWRIDARTAPTGSGITVQWEHGDTNDLDTVASWTDIDTDTLPAGSKSASFAVFTNGTIPSQRLIRFNIDAVGSTVPGQNVSAMLITRGPLT